ncbi:hypothetical protein MMC25_000849, partial [Agyrium rufum]|nr:hypothetical protein [Agyrium rufum]
TVYNGTSKATPISRITPVRRMVDAATQYSPPQPREGDADVAVTASAKRKGRSPSPRLPQLAGESSRTIKTDMESLGEKIEAPPVISIPKVVGGRATPPVRQSPSKRVRQPKEAIHHMPGRYETCDVHDLVLLISDMLMELVRFNDQIPLRDGGLTRFHSRAPPGISIADYLQRLTTHATLSPPILLSMVYYIDRLCALYPAFTISSLTVHRFLITSATVASKGLSDSFWTNNTYARIGGVSLKELALLELEFLWRVEWRIVPKPEVLVDYYRSLIERSEDFEIEELDSPQGDS